MALDVKIIFVRHCLSSWDAVNTPPEVTSPPPLGGVPAGSGGGADGEATDAYRSASSPGGGEGVCAACWQGQRGRRPLVPRHVETNHMRGSRAVLSDMDINNHIAYFDNNLLVTTRALIRINLYHNNFCSRATFFMTK